MGPSFYFVSCKEVYSDGAQVVCSIITHQLFHYLETKSHCVALADLEIYVDQVGLQLIEVHLPLPVLKIKGVCHPSQNKTTLNVETWGT